MSRYVESGLSLDEVVLLISETQAMCFWHIMFSLGGTMPIGLIHA